MQARSKWNRPHKNLAEGNVVLVVDDALPGSQWRLGRVVEAFSGPDGSVRKVKILMEGTGIDGNGKRTTYNIWRDQYRN